MKNIITFIIILTFVLSGYSQISTAEYFVDTDPGVGNATAIALTAGNTINENFTIPTGGLSSGMHVLHIRVKGTNNIWSLYKRAYFYIQETSSSSSPEDIVAAEYFIDTDLGVANAAVLTITQGLNVTENFTIPTSGLSNGMHVLHIRVKDATNVWSLYRRVYFYVHQVNASSASTPIVTAEYFFDTDPGVGNATALTVTQGMTITANFTILVPSGMTDGDHYLHLRVQDQDGNWSLYKRALFTVDSALAIDEFSSDMVRIYPNPTAAILHIDFVEDTIYSFTIFAANGREITQKNNTLLNNQIDLSTYASGVYFIQLRSKTTKETVILKFIKQ
jgi:hypothetical protein